MWTRYTKKHINYVHNRIKLAKNNIFRLFKRSVIKTFDRYQKFSTNRNLRAVQISGKRYPKRYLFALLAANKQQKFWVRNEPVIRFLVVSCKVSIGNQLNQHICFVCKQEATLHCLISRLLKMFINLITVYIHGEYQFDRIYSSEYRELEATPTSTVTFKL